MARSDNEDDDIGALRPLSATQARVLEQAARRLHARRQRDLLPVRIATP